MPEPREVFDDSFRIAKLLLQIYRLLENEGLVTEGEQIEQLRKLLAATAHEHLQLLLNGVFLGCIRERADVPAASLGAPSLSNLLRQAVVSACTAYEAYLSALLAKHVFVVIEVKQHEFFPTDKEVADYFKELSLTIGESFRLLSNEERAVFLGNKIVSFVRGKNLGSVSGLKTVGLLLGLTQPWDQVAEHLNRDVRDVRRPVNECIERRNAIVHRGDRNPEAETLEKQPIGLAWTLQAVETVGHVCFALDEIVEVRMREFKELLNTRKEGAHA